MASLTMSEARASLSEVLDRVEAGEDVTITRHGRPVALVVRPDRVRNPRAAAAFAEADRVRVWLEQGRNTPLASEGGLTAGYAEELIASIRADRDAD